MYSYPQNVWLSTFLIFKEGEGLFLARFDLQIRIFLSEKHTGFMKGVTSTMTWQIKMQLHYSYNNENKKKEHASAPSKSR